MNLETLKSAVNNKKNWSLKVIKKEFKTFYILNKGNDVNHIFESLFFGGDVEMENELFFIETYSQKNGTAKKGFMHKFNLENSIEKYV
mgnify:CR=1 FL=1